MPGILEEILGMNQQPNNPGALAIQPPMLQGQRPQPQQGLTLNDFMVKPPEQTNVQAFQKDMNNLEWWEKAARGWLIGQEGRDPYQARYEAAKQMDAQIRQQALAKQKAKNNFHNYNLDQEQFKHSQKMADKNYSLNEQRAENENLQLKSTLAQQAAQRHQWDVANQNAERSFDASQSAPKAQIYDPATGNVIGHTTASGEQVMYDTPYADAKTVKAKQPDKTMQKTYDQFAVGTATLLKKVKEYRDLVEKNGTMSGLFDPEETGKAKALIGDITAAYKDYKKLGTFDAGVENLIGKIIPDMTTVGSWYTRNDQAVAQIDGFSDSIRQDLISQLELAKQRNLKIPDINGLDISGSSSKPQAQLVKPGQNPAVDALLDKYK